MLFARSSRFDSCYPLDPTRLLLFTRRDSDHAVFSTQLHSDHGIRFSGIASCYSLDSTRLMSFARLDWTRLDSAYYQSSLLLSELAFPQSQCDDRFGWISLHRNATINLNFASSQCDDQSGFCFITVPRSIWMSLHHNATIDLDFALSQCDDRFGFRFDDRFGFRFIKM
jgi:hypothetical protein